MQIHELKSPKSAHKRRRIVGRGRGSGLGKTSGRGENGQGSREGRGILNALEGGQMPLVRRVAKVGFTNRNHIEYEVVKTGQLDIFDNGTVVTVELLKANKILSSMRKPFKVLNKGALTKKLTVQAHAFSKTAKEMITKAGGKAEVINK